MSTKSICLNILLISFFFLVPELAHAYIDPGSGSMLIQALLAVLAAVSVSLGLFWKRIRSFFDRILKRDKEK